MIDKQDIRDVNITRYITPLREGGSLPALVDADDGFQYVIKFRGAGQGKKALIAEVIGAELAKVMGLRVPELVYACLDESFGRTEPDEEIQDLLKFSTGLNLGVSFLSGAITYDPNAIEVDAYEASKIVWLDAFIMNVDRTFKNTNLLIWNRELWLIDHGASLYFHHTWDDWKEQSVKKFVQIKDHVLLSKAKYIDKVDREYRQMFSHDLFEHILSQVPDEWLENETVKVDEAKEVYTSFLSNRIANADIFIDEIEKARESRI